jgi:asparagine synthase (glutamine-hydrolysing)
VARHLGLDPRHYPVAEDGAASLQSVMGHFDEPFADSSALPTMLICRAARRDLTVALSGDGGDELFGGYENHLRAWRFRSMDSVPPPVRRSIGRVLAAVSPADSRLRRFAKRLPHRLGMFGLGAKLYPFEDWIGTCVREPYRLNDSLACELIRLNHRSLAEEDTAEHPQQVDLRLYLLDDVLVKVDRMSMWHSLEVRSPFLDYRVVELALRLPLGLHVAGGRSKHLTRLLAGRVLPRPVADAPKRGFAIPLRDWLLRGPMTETFRRMTRELEEEGWVLLPNAADRVWRAAESNPALTAALFRLLALSMWLRATSQGIPQQDGRGRTHSEWYASHGTPVSGHRHV